MVSPCNRAAPQPVTLILNTSTMGVSRAGVQSLPQHPHRAQGHAQAGTTPRAGPHPWPGSFCRLGDIWGLPSAGPASQGTEDDEQQNRAPHLPSPLPSRDQTSSCDLLSDGTEGVSLNTSTEGCGTRYFPSDAQGLWLQAHTLAVTRSRATTSTRDQWIQPASTWSHPVPCHCSLGQSAGVSSCWQAPTQGTQYRRSGCGHQL